MPFWFETGTQAKLQSILGKDTMRKQKCEICGTRIEPGYIERHHIVPTQVTEQAGLPESQTLELCSDCHREVHARYSANVSEMAYDLQTKQFRTKSGVELVKEYHSALNSFIKYKKNE